MMREYEQKRKLWRSNMNEKENVRGYVYQVEEER